MKLSPNFVMASGTKRSRGNEKAASPLPLGRQARRVLSNVFRLSDASQTGVDARTYRARHEKQWETLDELERYGYLRKEQNTNSYFVSVAGLSQLSAKSAKRLLTDFERLFIELKRRYKQDPHAKVQLSDLVQTTGMAFGEVKKALSYMTELSIWGGHNLNAENTPDADIYIQPSENVVSTKYRKFRDLITERLQLFENNKRRQKGSNTTPQFWRGSTEESSISLLHIERQSWCRSLKPGLRCLMAEIDRAIDADARTLAAMGLRAIVDMSCNDVLGDIGDFGRKLQTLQSGGHITESQRRTLRNVLELGHAAAHRGHVPSKSELVILRDIIESLLKQLYVHEPASEKLKSRVPARNLIKKA